MTRRETFLVALIALVAVAARLLPGPRTIDDAYITFRYARNILAGNGFVYNAGERVLGTTTPLYTGLMAAAAGLSGRRDPTTGLASGFPELALIANAVADGISVWILYRLGKRLGNGPLVGIALAAAWAVNPISVTFAIGGMETSVFVMLILGTFAASLDGRPRATGALAALALLTRPEALIAISLLAGNGLLNLLRRRNTIGLDRSRDSVLCFAALLAPWLIFATLYFGSPIPGSISAKSVAYQLPAEHALLNFLLTLVVPFSGVGSFHPVAGLLVVAGYFVLFILGAWRTARNDVSTWPLFGFFVVYVGAYIVANPLIFRWYVVPPLPIFLLGIVLGLNTIAAAFKRPRLTATMISAGAVIAVGTAFGGWGVVDRGLPVPRMAYIEVELTYLRAAARLAGELNPDTVIAAGDIGALGYATGAHIYDTLGLITPQARRYYPVPHAAIVGTMPYAIPGQLILDAQPDFIVIMEAYGRNTFIADPNFQARYTLIETLHSGADPLYSSTGMLIFKRNAD